MRLKPKMVRDDEGADSKERASKVDRGKNDTRHDAATTSRHFKRGCSKFSMGSLLKEHHLKGLKHLATGDVTVNSFVYVIIGQA